MIHDDGVFPDDDPELADLITAVNQAEGELIEAQEDRDKARAALVEHLLARGERTVTGRNDEGEIFRVTVVSRETTTIDDEALKAKIGARAWNALTVRKVDKKKVEEAVAKGKLDLSVLAEVTEIRQGATWPKLTRVDG